MNRRFPDTKLAARIRVKDPDAEVKLQPIGPASFAIRVVPTGDAVRDFLLEGAPRDLETDEELAARFQDVVWKPWPPKWGAVPTARITTE